jgi:hypothetical protein
MHSSRRTRLIAACIAIFSMLFMQLAVASYACPTMASPLMRTAAAATAEMHQAMPGCKGMGMDTVQPSLCHAHDQAGTQSLDKPDLPQVQPFLAVGLTMTVLPLQPALPDARIDASDILLARATAPPIAIRHCCFRT